MPDRKNSVLRLFGLTLALACAGRLPAAFELNGELPPAFAKGPVTVLRESLEARASEPVATAPMVNGRFHLRVESGPGLFNLQIGDTTASFVAADGQNFQVKAAADGNALQIVGGADHELFAAYETFRAESLARKVTPVREAILASQSAGNAAEVARLTEREVAGYLEHRRELNDFTLAKLGGSAALYAASLRWDGDYRLDELAAAVRDFARRFPRAEIARLMEERISRFRATAIGATAPALAGVGPDGVRTALADLRGHIVLVDFWASWCAPCRVENRNYAELYQRHRPAGFEILAVSVDQNAPAWKAAIAKDGAAWRNISDLTGWQSPLAGAYNVSALPASFLLDPEGRIIAKNLRGKPLADRLDALLRGQKSPP